MDFKYRKIRRDRLNAFAVRRINERRTGSRLWENAGSFFSALSQYKIFTPRNTIILSAIVSIFLIFTAINLVRGIQLKNVVFFFGKDLATDDYGHTNILLLGTGGGEHEGADLTDTIIIASINQATNNVTLLSIPRDLYISNEKMGTRINNLYHMGKNDLGNEQLGLSMIHEKVQEVTNMDIHYFVKVEFEGFKEIIDALDGIDIDVPESIYDPEYPRGENIGYEIFSVPAGMQHMDGDTALKYARSRHSTNDFNRSKRQQLVLYAIKEKADKLGILGDSGEIQDLYESLQKSMQTDLSLREIITLAKIGSQVKRESIASYTIHDDPAKCGGLLYTPSRDLYGGASVLVAATKGDKDIHNMTDIVMNHPEFRTQGIKLQILNGTKGLGLAAESKILLNRLCVDVVRFGNGQSKDIQKTTYFIKTPVPESVLETLQKLIPGEISNVVPQKYLDVPYASEAQIVIEIGQDYLPRKMKDPYDGLVDLLPKEKTMSGEADPATEGSTPGTSTSTEKGAAKTSTTPLPPKKK